MVGELVGFGPQRDEASLSSTTLSLRKTLTWEHKSNVFFPCFGGWGVIFLGLYLTPMLEAFCYSFPFPDSLSVVESNCKIDLNTKAGQQQRSVLPGGAELGTLFLLPVPNQNM